MAKILPDTFHTELDDGLFLVMVDEKAEHPLMAWDLEWLAGRMLNGERIDAIDKAIAGAALSHLLNLSKSQKNPA
jgi:hypothetical protein